MSNSNKKEEPLKLDMDFEAALKGMLKSNPFKKMTIDEMIDISQEKKIMEIKLKNKNETIFAKLAMVQLNPLNAGIFDEVLNFSAVMAQKEMPNIISRKINEDEIEGVLVTDYKI